MACGYELQGLSIRETCPECGLPVRATLLARVDPQAPELLPVSMPRLRVIALGLWVAAGMLLVVLSWGLRFDDAMTVLSNGSRQLRWLAPLGSVALACSGLGTLAFVNPTPGSSRRLSLLALGGAVLHIPLAWLYWLIQVRSDSIYPVAYFDTAYGGARGAERALLALAFNLLFVVVVLLLRPSARLLVKRSAVLRKRAVDRQTMLMMIASLTIASAGQVLLFLSMTSWWNAPQGIGSLGAVMVGLGSVLLTMAAIATAYDTCLLMPVVLKGPKTLADVFMSARTRADTRRASSRR